MLNDTEILKWLREHNATLEFQKETWHKKENPDTRISIRFYDLPVPPYADPKGGICVSLSPQAIDVSTVDNVNVALNEMIWRFEKEEAKLQIVKVDNDRLPTETLR